MEDIKTTKVNNAAADLPEEFKRDPETGKIIIDDFRLGTSKRNNAIVPDDIFDKYYRDLPDKVENASGTWRTVSTGGKIKILGGDPENDKEIHKAGGEALQATIKQQRTFAEAINTLLAQKASKQNIEDLELNDKADNLDVVIASMLKQAARGNVKAGEFIRDTIGQKPATEVNATLEEITPEDKELLQRVNARLNSNT